MCVWIIISPCDHAYTDCGWRRLPPGMEGSCQYIEWTDYVNWRNGTPEWGLRGSLTANHKSHHHNLYPIRSIIRADWSVGSRWHTRERGTVYTEFWWETPKGRSHLEELDVNGITVNTSRESVRMWTWLFCSGYGPVAGCCECGFEPLGSLRDGECRDQLNDPRLFTTFAVWGFTVVTYPSYPCFKVERYHNQVPSY